MLTTEFVREIHADTPPFSLIEQENLFSRLIREVEGAVRELTRDPRSFFGNLFSADTKDAKRRQRIYAGLTCAVMVHLALSLIIAVLGWRTVFVKVEEPPVPHVVWVPQTSPDNLRLNAPRGEKGNGGGGGGDQNPLPVTKGPTPQMSPNPQIVKPNTPHLILPSIQVPPTIVGPDRSAPPQGIALGVPSGVIAEAPSPGDGKGGGLGSRDGSGAGSGNGPGGGRGNGGAAGDRGRNGLPNGSDVPNVPISFNAIDKYPDRTPIVWLHRPTPVITPEAQANKVKGEVWLRATFGDDGKISDIQVIRDVPFMTESAVEALKQSRFRPATIKGRPVTLLNVPVRINVDVIRR